MFRFEEKSLYSYLMWQCHEICWQVLAVLENYGFPQSFRKINMWGLISHRFTLKKVRLRALLAAGKSPISRISLQKRIFHQNYFSLFIRGQGRLVL